MDLQQECDDGMCSPPHWEATWRQHARSAGVSTADGNVQAMNGAPPIRSTKSNTQDLANRLIAVIVGRSYLWRNRQEILWNWG